MDKKQAILQKLRRYSDGVAKITEDLLNEDITEHEAEDKLIALDEHFAARILSVKL